MAAPSRGRTCGIGGDSRLVALGTQAEEVRDFDEQAARRRRFDHEAIEQIRSGFQPLVVGAAGHQDDRWQVVPGFLFTDLLQDLQTVLVRHAQVEQHGEIVGCSVARRRQQRRPAGYASLGTQADLAQLGGDGRLHGRIVVNKQHRPFAVGGHLLRHLRPLRHLAGIDPEADEEGETAALSWRALDADLAAHQIDQLLADGEPQAGAAVAARCRRVGLREGVEQARSLALGEPDAFIDDGNDEIGRALVDGIGANANDDVALL